MSYEENDPLNLERVDREIRINQLREEINELSGNQMVTGGNPDCPPEVMEQFLEHVLAFEKGEWTTHVKQLTKVGITLPAPDELDDASLTAKLWEVIEALARLRVFLYNTNHLSDRELYTRLVTDLLQEEVVDMSADENGAWNIDMLGSGSEEDKALRLKFYADEAERRDWAERYPEEIIPPHENPPCDRDRHLPKRE